MVAIASADTATSAATVPTGGEFKATFPSCITIPGMGFTCPPSALMLSIGTTVPADGRVDGYGLEAWLISDQTCAAYYIGRNFLFWVTTVVNTGERYGVFGYNGLLAGYPFPADASFFGPAPEKASFSVLLRNTGKPFTFKASPESSVTLNLDSAGRRWGMNTLSVAVPAASAPGCLPDRSAPFGVVDTPASNTAVSGAVSVTGWALDDTGVTRVEIWRKAIAGEPNVNGQVYVGEGTFVEGARPDVAALYPNAARKERGGWGVQVLTNMLPNASGNGPRGNGQHQLYVYAFDKAQRATLLGAPVIHVDNASATKPFGTIDTPGSGQAASGTFPVWGWALTPQPATVPKDGSTIWVFVDGVPLGHPAYNIFRIDVSSLFPELQNSHGPVGVFQLDTTSLANGLHSIASSVTDNFARTEGLGSRLFNVQNAAASSAVSAAFTEKPRRTAARGGLWARTGHDPHAPLEPLSGAVDVRQGSRIELHLGAMNTGCLVSGEQCRDLPIGSKLDAGVFYWQLHPAFLGNYELRFQGEGGMLSVPVHVAAE